MALYKLVFNCNFNFSCLHAWPQLINGVCGFQAKGQYSFLCLSRNHLLTVTQLTSLLYSACLLITKASSVEGFVRGILFLLKLQLKLLRSTYLFRHDLKTFLFSFCLWAPEYGLTLWCTLSLLVGVKYKCLSYSYSYSYSRLSYGSGIRLWSVSPLSVSVSYFYRLLQFLYTEWCLSAQPGHGVNRQLIYYKWAYLVWKVNNWGS